MLSEAAGSRLPVTQQIASSCSDSPDKGEQGGKSCLIKQQRQWGISADSLESVAETWQIFITKFPSFLCPSSALDDCCLLTRTSHSYTGNTPLHFNKCSFSAIGLWVAEKKKWIEQLVKYMIRCTEENKDCKTPCWFYYKCYINSFYTFISCSQQNQNLTSNLTTYCLCLANVNIIKELFT